MIRDGRGLGVFLHVRVDGDGGDPTSIPKMSLRVSSSTIKSVHPDRPPEVSSLDGMRWGCVGSRRLLVSGGFPLPPSLRSTLTPWSKGTDDTDVERAERPTPLYDEVTQGLLG